MKRFFIYATAAITACCLSCNGIGQPNDPGHNGDTQEEDNFTHLHFIYDTKDFANPERGFYYPYSFTRAGNAVSASDIKSQRKYNRTLVLLEFYLAKYINSDIDQAYLDMIDECFKNVRTAGAKAIVRFAYVSSENSHPYDPTEEQTLRHIAQVKPVLQANSDVILVLQAGFVGVWGEWYYTDNFIQNPSKTDDYLPRKHVCDALLDALPENRQIELRTPAFKMKMYGLTVNDTITRATAHDGSPMSRLGGHNDCFVANASDYGTYNGSNERKFWQGDTRYTIMGGETCDATTKYCHCELSIPEMEKYHWTYLNIDYNKSVLNIWKDEYCYDEATLRLGYRLYIPEITYDKDATAGKPFTINLYIENEGFAAPQNPRDAYLIFSNGSNEIKMELGSDPRFWMEGTTTEVSKEITLDTPGTYKMYLYLPDPEERLKDNPNYAIRLANNGCWVENKGYNALGEIIVNQ